MPKWIDLIIMIGLGLLCRLSTFFMSQAYRISKELKKAPFYYVAIPSSIFWSIIIFGEWPNIVS